MRSKVLLSFLIGACIATPLLMLHVLVNVNPFQIQAWLRNWGIWAPVLYVVLYVVATVLVLPSTVLNLSGGALFGPWLGTVWASLGAVIAAIAAFVFTRTVGREAVAKHLFGRWQAMDEEIRQGGFFYLFAIRLLPILPYGLVNFAAGLSSVSFRDYFWGTTLGTVPGVLPFVLLGSSGIRVLKTGDWLPIVGSFTLIGLLVGGSTWYRRNLKKIL